MHTFEKIEAGATALAEAAGVSGMFPVPLEKLAAHLGFMTFSFKGKPSVSGAIKYREKKIFINSDEPLVRQRFTLAHEIGHAVLHKGEDIIDYRANIDGPKDNREREANVFAANLLMPKKEFISIWKARSGIAAQVAKHFGVSSTSAGYRAANLGLS